LKELGVQEFKLNGVLNIGDRAQVRIRILLGKLVCMIGYEDK